MSEGWNHQTAFVNGVRIHYVVHGSGDPVMLIHGWPEMWYSWRKQIPELAKKYQVIAPDLRGFGYSDKPLTGYDTRSAATDLYELAKVLGHEHISLVGHDIGVRIAYRYALDFPTDRLVVVDSPPPYSQYQPVVGNTMHARWHSFFHQVPDLPELLVGGNIEAYLRHFYRDWSLNTNVFTDEEIGQYVKAYSQPGALRGGFGYYRAAFLEDIPDWEKDADRKLDIPTLVLWGERRARLSGGHPQEPLHVWQKYIPNAQGQQIEGGGHFLHEECPQQVTEAILKFLASI